MKLLVSTTIAVCLMTSVGLADDAIKPYEDLKLFNTLETYETYSAKQAKTAESKPNMYRQEDINDCMTRQNTELYDSFVRPNVEHDYDPIILNPYTLPLKE